MSERPASVDEVREFASRDVFGTLKERYTRREFSRDIWRRMGDLGLLGLTVDPEYGGSGGSAGELAAMLEMFASDSCDLGLCLGWITHLALTVKSIENFGTQEQKETYLPALCSGEMVGATAVSEAGTGAHPAGMETTGVRCADGFVLNGRKLYTTDGPVADLLLVLAVTGEEPPDRKQISAFLVETDREGVCASTMELNFLLTSPHGEMTFNDVYLGREAMLGTQGEGHSRVSREAFGRERSCVLGAVCGIYSKAAREVSDRYRQKYEGISLAGKEAGAWIHHLAAVDAYRRLTSELVEAAFEGGVRWRESMDLLIYMGLSYAKWGFWLGDFVKDNELEATFPLDIILSDIKIVLVNEGLLLKEGRKRYLR